MAENSNEMERSFPKLTGNYIKEQRDRLYFTQSQLCDAILSECGTKPNKSTVAKWEAQKRNKIKCSAIYGEALIRIFEKVNNKNPYFNLVNTLMPINNRNDISGVYKSIWKFEHKLERGISEETLTLSYKQDIITGISTDGKYEYQMFGFLNTDNIYSGHWYNTSNSHHGTFIHKFYLDFRGSEGKWIGTYDRSRKKRIKDIGPDLMIGDWQLEKI